MRRVLHLAAGLSALAVLFIAMPARAQPTALSPAYEPPRPFNRGSLNLGFALGMGSSLGQGTAISAGGHFGYFVLPGLEPGLEVGVTFGSGLATVTSLLPYLRWVIWRSYFVSPYLKLQGGHWFVAGRPDLSPIGGGGGLVWFLTDFLAVQLEGMVYRLLPSENCGDQCVANSFGLSFGFFFGGRRSLPPPLPPPPPPPPPPPSPPPSLSPSPEPVHEAQQRQAPSSLPSTDEPGVR